MIISRVTEKDLHAAAKAARVTFLRFHAIAGRRKAFRFRLAPIGDTWTRYSASPFTTRRGKRRRVHAVCWHGMRAFMRALYARVPDARIATAFVTYRDMEHFEEAHAATAAKQVGSILAPVAFAELCEHGYGRAQGTEPDTIKIDASYYAALYSRETSHV